MNDTVTVVSPNSQWNWIPSNIRVGVGRMSNKQVVFPPAPVFARKSIRFPQAKAVAPGSPSTRSASSPTPLPRSPSRHMCRAARKPTRHTGDIR